jgi:hypothetical protein
VTDELTRKQRADLNRQRNLVGDIQDVMAALLEGPSVDKPQGVLELAHVAAALVTTGDSPGSGWKTDQVTSSVVSDPTGNAVTLDAYINALSTDNADRLRKLRDDAHRLWEQHTQLASYLTERPHRPPAGQGECMVDGEFVPGIGNDRIKRGLCPRHYKQWQRAGYPEVVQYPEQPDTEGSPIRATFDGCDEEVKAA